MTVINTTTLPHPKYRPDIDGLRAIAVLSVVAFHAFPDWIRGGFIGVDVFFVISGYLISSIIFNGLDKGTFSFSVFYARRIKRIFPALLVVLIFGYLMGWFVLFADEYQQLGKHIAAGASFISNYVLWNEAGYFDNSAETKPLLHLWSLGIEEQFYIIWPFLLWLVWKMRLMPLLLILGVAALSFYLNIKGVKKEPVASFYSPQTRFWELLSGSLLAYSALYGKANVSDIRGVSVFLRAETLKNMLSWLGVMLLCLGFFTINKYLRFPGKLALVPVFSAVCIIAAGPHAWFNRHVLSNPLAIWIGLISFPLYLWHWPLLAFVRIIDSEEPAVSIRIIAVIGSVVLAWCTYAWIEKPLRFGTSMRFKTPALVCAMLLVGAVGFGTYQQEGLPSRNNEQSLNIQQFKLPEMTAQRAWCNQLFPDYPGHCLASERIGALNTVEHVFWGDSHAEALSMGVMDSPNGTKTLSLGKPGCLPLQGVERYTENGPNHCEGATQPVLALFRDQRLPAGSLIMTARFSAYVEGTGYGDIDIKPRGPGNLHIQWQGPRIDASAGLYQQVFFDGWFNTLRLLSPLAHRLIIVQQVPELGFDPRKCMERSLRLHAMDCTLPRSEVLQRQMRYRQLLKQVTDQFPNVIVYDPLDVFCDAAFCHVVRDGKMLYRDDDHVSVLGAKAIIADMQAKGFW